MTIMFEVSLHFWQIWPFVWRQHNKPKASSKKPTLIKCKWYSAQIEQPREKRKVLTAQIVLPCMIRPVAHTHTAHHHTHHYRVVVYRKSCQQLLFRTSHISLDAYFSLLLSARAPGLKFRSGGTVLKFVWNKNWICPELVFTWVKAIKVICNSFLCYSLLPPPFLPYLVSYPEVSRPRGTLGDGLQFDPINILCFKQSLKIFIFHLMHSFLCCSLLPPPFCPRPRSRI